ncbi:MAG: leukotoxin LktA family filamentous adhesin, partial [Selenomonas sp.]|nr:leukotoxin LktA family filamentous adhesin [Selenomonas sp.]
MNKTYKIIWSHVRKCYVVVSEYAKSHGKNNTRSVLARVMPVLFGGALLASAAMPSLAAAQDIEKVSGAKFNDTVNNIYADKMVNSVAVNAFKNFKLDAGNIANMHMGTAPGSTNASSLVNFVNNQASISGTVNAVKNGGIGGNLYFLSPNGVVVGSSGVINAGSVHLMAPSQSQYNV